MLAHDHEYGFVSALSRDIDVSRQTLYTWKTQAALERAFTNTTATTVVTPPTWPAIS